MLSLTRVLVLDADEARAKSLVGLLAPAGFDTWHEQSLPSTPDAADVVLLSVDAFETSAFTRLAACMPEADILILTGRLACRDARAALRLGACDVIDRDAGGEVLLASVERAAQEGRNRRELALLRARVGDAARQALVGASPSMERVRDLVGCAAASRRTVVVTGEAGTGKSTVARLVHDLSERAGRPFVVARCDGADFRALDVELFGAEHGGLLETARGGTLVLDEARALPRAMYARLATMSAERVVRRGESAERRAVDVRLVLTARTAADEPTIDAIDMLGNRNVLPIALPPLRERRRDIPLLVRHFHERLSRERGVAPPIPPETMAPLLAHVWTGNVRELEHWMDRIACAGIGDGASAPRQVVAPGADFAQLDAAHLTLEALERKYILHVLGQEAGHQSRAAERLGIDRRTLYRKLKEYRECGVTVRIAG